MKSTTTRPTFPVDGYFVDIKRDLRKGDHKMNYFKELLEMIDSDSLDELISKIDGSEAAEKAINEINDLIGENQEFKEKFSQCIAFQNELWFNIGWSFGWTAGATTIAKLARLDSPDISKITKLTNFNSD